ncbi:MAG: alginate export family protein [Nitrospiraceae bacterium]
MGRIFQSKRWLRRSITFAAAVLVASLQVLTLPLFTTHSPAYAGYQLPPGERVTNLPAIPRNMPQKEGYEAYDPVIGRNFDVKNFWLRADLRVRPEMRNGVCFGGGAPTGGACNGFQNGNALNANAGRGANDFFVQQWVRLGIGYDLSPDVNYYMEIIDSAVWGGNGNPNNAGNGGDPLNHNCGPNTSGTQANCRLGVRAAYVLVRNLGGVQGLSMKAGRQYIVLGNQSLFGHFDWANTGYSHDGVMFQYSTKSFESYLGWFRHSETDLVQGSAVGSGSANIAGCAGGTPGAPCTAAQRAGTTDGGSDADMFIFYNQIKSIPGILFEPYYVLYSNRMAEGVNTAQGMGTAKKSKQLRHMIGQRTELRKGGVDAILETSYQFGQMADGLGNDNQKNVHINAWALRSWLGYTAYSSKLKPRFALGFDYASGSGNANCSAGGVSQPGYTCAGAGNTFENFFPTNHIHMGYMDIMAWRNMLSPQVNFQMRPSARDHFEIWYSHFRLANARDNWYRGSQGVYVFSKTGNTENHIGDEIDFTWTRMFADGKVAVQATWGHMFTGDYIKQNLNTNSDQDWAYLSLWMNF